MQLKAQYESDGFVSGVPIVSVNEAASARQDLENAEAEVGALHYYNKMHLFIESAYNLATHKNVLDVVEQCIGENILLYNCTYIIKEPQTETFVSWHQDLTYWGLSSDDQVSMWLALSTADEVSGCMRMIAGSHKQGMAAHVRTDDSNNVLDLGQTVSGVDESGATLCALQAGEASFHHGWTLHASSPNKSHDRRIGLNVQFIAPHVRQLKQPNDSALLVRGVDEHNFYHKDEVVSKAMSKANFSIVQEYRNRFIETYNA